MLKYDKEQVKEVLRVLQNYKKVVDVTDNELDFRMSILDLGLKHMNNTGLFAQKMPKLRMHYLTEQDILKRWSENILPKYVDNTPPLELILEYQKTLHPDILKYFTHYAEQKAMLDATVIWDIPGNLIEEIFLRIKKTDIEPALVKELEIEVLKEYLEHAKKGDYAKVSIDLDDPLRSHLNIKTSMNYLFMGHYSFFNIKDNFDVTNYHPGKYLKTEELENLLDREKYIDNERYGGIRQTIKLKNDKNGKVKSVLKLDERGIFLKYMTFGLLGNKKDIVLKMDPDDNHRILHIENDNIQIKNYNDGENKLFIEEQVQHPKLVEAELSKFNDVELFYKDGKLNLPAIGGEGLLYSVDFIMKNYDDIQKIASK